MMEKVEDQPIQKAIFTGNGGSDHDWVLAVRAGLYPGRVYEVRCAGFRHGVEFVDVINIGQFNSVMFKKSMKEIEQ